ncbi:class I ribonucleotide reductase maintenance protein YfaE [Lentisphaera marina]|uniref:class I ribonucleotide reductase maintenance protein YfaE n=1 Tax=Lentisphaera marina TaxID=1111041 RepID=UPI0023652536|nr:class I ribonucleotide reductase maintenance protein YfaE [Lentisphaera marina]MDD7983342.1 class I ribonucleotide reductase maintenance protein YfaE [Lentisphaera marina]
MAKIHIEDKHCFEAQGDISLLEELEAQNLDVNYSCRSGFCGACKATVVKGDVEHLESSMCKLAKDEILTCCSKAMGDIELSFKEKVNIFQSAYALNI